MNQITELASVSPLSDEASFDPIEDRLRANVRATIEAMFEEELAEFLGRLRYGRADGGRRTTATGTASGSSPEPSEPRRCVSRAPGSRTIRAR